MESNQYTRPIRRTLSRISPRLNAQVRYFSNYHKFANLRHPETFDEKILWLLLNNYGANDVVRQCADKYAVRDYVKQRGCEEILNTLYGVYACVDDIDWAALPDKFVIKINIGCQYNLICQDKTTLDIEKAKNTLKAWCRESKTFWLEYGETHYKDMPLKMICERFIESKDGLLPADYKLFCFNGVPTDVMMCTKRETGHPEFYFFDRDKRLARLNKRGLAAPEGFTIEMPRVYDELFTYAEKLSKGFPFVRSDFYIENDKVIFGELTFTPCGGVDPNIPHEQNLFIGSKIKL